ncbi:hypothetical protein ACO0KY_18985 [Undibacterium sp. Dicai25W]|uniref:hypothetical protein n=1 Tax=Undibacterium sp. Dicai25W TaxID=3413034 RepID=UPI003BF093BC
MTNIPIHHQPPAIPVFAASNCVSFYAYSLARKANTGAGLTGDADLSQNRPI